MVFVIILIIGILLTLIGIYKRKENYGKAFLIIGILLLLVILYMDCVVSIVPPM